MFGNLIYYNKKKVDQYSTLILGHAADWESAEKVDNDNKASNYLLECAKFEEILQQRDDYFDFAGDSQSTSIKMLEFLQSSALRAKFMSQSSLI